MKTTTWFVALICLSLIPCIAVAEEPGLDEAAFNECLLEKIKTAGPETTAQEIREACLLEVRGEGTKEPTTGISAADPAGMSPLDERIEGIKATEELEPALCPLHLRERQPRIQRQTLDHHR